MKSSVVRSTGEQGLPRRRYLAARPVYRFEDSLKGLVLKAAPLSQVCHRFEPLPQVLRNVRCRNSKPLENAAVISVIASAEQRLGRTGRLIIRPSGTEPVIRVLGEGDDKMLVEEVVDGIVEALSQSCGLIGSSVHVAR
jgi:phosphomannomutase